MVLKFLLVVVVVVIVIIVVFVVVIVVVIVVFGCAAGAALSSILVVIIVVAINVVVVDLFVWTMWPFCCHRCYRRQRQSSLTSLFFAYVSSSLVCHYCTLGRYQMISMVLVSYGLKMLMLYALRYSI